MICRDDHNDWNGFLAGICLAVTLIVSAPGCAAYRFGAESIFPTGIRTVHIPVADNQTFRHDLGVRLTESLVRQVEQNTPYKVVSDPYADSILECTVHSESKVVLAETASDDPRALDAIVSVDASWRTRDGRGLMQNRPTSADGDSIGFSQSVRMVPEAGQSADMAMQDAIDRLARRIVSQMEARW